MVGSFGWAEIFIIVVVVIIFMGGGSRLPEFASSLGEAIREFKRSVNRNTNSQKDEPDDSDESPSNDSP